MGILRWWFALVSCFLCIITMTVRSSDAARFSIFERPLNLYGLISQHVQYGFYDEYDTFEGINQAMTSVVMEGDFSPTDDFALYGMVTLTGDLAYPLNNDDDTWKRRQFDKSDNLAFDDEYWQILREIHVTWTPGNSRIRVGKQIVSWGELLGVRVLDQINPTDAQRNPSALELETTKVPTWMARYDYGFSFSNNWLSNASLQLVYDPNVDNDIYSRSVEFGNAKGGIWAGYLEIPPLGISGTRNLRLDKPEQWSDPRTIGARVQALIGDTVTSLNFLYGRDSLPLTYTAGFATFTPGTPTLVHANQAAFFPIRKMIGGMVATELGFVPRIGGMISPMMRVEASYGWDSEYTVGFLPQDVAFGKYDDIKVAASLEFGFPIRWLNPSNLIRLTTMYYLRSITHIDGPSGDTITTTEGPVERDNHTTTFQIVSKYWNGRITPSVAWFRLWTAEADTYTGSLSYSNSKKWSYILSGQIFDSKAGIYDRKDSIAFKVQYKIN